MLFNVKPEVVHFVDVAIDQYCIL